MNSCRLGQSYRAQNRPENGEFAINFPVRREMQPETGLVQTASTASFISTVESAAWMREEIRFPCEIGLSVPTRRMRETAVAS
jgi:hypothetical protein